MRSPGIDGMTVAELPDWLKVHWPRVREQLLEGTYQPMAVRRATIPKPGGGERELGIPTVLDPLDSAGLVANPAAAIRLDLLRTQPWLSAETFGARSDP